MKQCAEDGHLSKENETTTLRRTTAKTEVLWCTSSQRQSQLPQSPLRVGSDKVTPVTSVRDLGIFLDSDAAMKTHISRTVSSCFCVLRQLRSICRSVSSAVLQSLVVSLVLSRLDYGNATLTVCLPDRKASVSPERSCTADILGSQVRSDHAAFTRSPLAPCATTDRLQTRESSFTGVCTVRLHRISLPSFNEWLTWSPIGVCGRHRRQLSSSRLLGTARLATVRFRRQHLVYGTVHRHWVTESCGFQAAVENSSVHCQLFQQLNH